MSAWWTPWAMWIAVAVAGPGIEDVRRPLATDAVVNWTLHQVELTTEAYDPNLVSDARPLEQRAMDAANARMADVAYQVPIFGDMVLGEAKGVELRRQAAAWQIAASRYHASGKVAVVGTLALGPVLAPWSVARSVDIPPDLPTAVSGVVIDARGLGLTPTWAPRIVSADGEVLFEGVQWRHVAWDSPPVVWVSSPMAPAAQAAGETPALFVAAGTDGRALTLSAEDAARWMAEVAVTRGVGAGAVVVVVDP